MIVALTIALAVTLLATMWARQLARRRGRHINGWTLATAALPPVVLILWALPIRGSSSTV